MNKYNLVGVKLEDQAEASLTHLNVDSSFFILCWGKAKKHTKHLRVSLMRRKMNLVGMF